MARMSSAFCCTSLKNGTLIVGWLTLAWIIIGLTLSTTILELQSKAIDIARSRSNLDDTLEKDNTSSVIFVVTAIIYVVSLIFIATIVCLLYGTDKGSRGFLIPYLVLFSIVLALNVLSLLYDICAGKRTVPLSIRLVYLGEPMSQEDMSKYQEVKLSAIVIFYGALSLCGVFAISLLYRASKGRRGFMLPWIIITAVGIAIAIKALVSDISTGLQGRYAEDATIKMTSLPISVYFISVVINYYIDLNPAKRASQDQSAASYTLQISETQDGHIAQPTTHYVRMENEDAFVALSLPENEFSEVP